MTFALRTVCFWPKADIGVADGHIRRLAAFDAIKGETKKTHNVRTKPPDECFLMPGQSPAG